MNEVTAPASMAAIVLAGGRSRRLPPQKLAEDLGGETVLDRTLSGLPTGLLIVCVGSAIPTARPTEWVRESPALGGPLAGVEAGLAAVPDHVSVVLVVAGDLPAAGRAVPALLTALGSDDPAAVAVLAEPTGRPQPLLAAWHRSALADTLLSLQPTADRAAAAMLDSVRLTGSIREVPDIWGASRDIDEPADLEAARSRTTD